MYIMQGKALDTDQPHCVSAYSTWRTAVDAADYGGDEWGIIFTCMTLPCLRCVCLEDVK
jgi:hypothetical protein